jgi:hypothetical protein
VVHWQSSLKGNLFFRCWFLQGADSCSYVETKIVSVISAVSHIGMEVAYRGADACNGERVLWEVVATARL